MALYADGTVITEFDDDVIQNNIALLGFKTAVNGDLVKYNLVDQIVDEYEDASGVDAGNSTSELLESGAYRGGGSNPTGGASVDTSVSGYRTHVFTSSAALTVTTAGSVDILVVAGGGSGAAGYGGGGGAGGLIYKTGHALTANTYDAVIGAGGAGITTQYTMGNNGVDSTWTINGGAVEFTAKGGGGGAQQASTALTGGSGGGAGQQGTGGAAIQGSRSGDSGTYGFGYAGGDGSGSSYYNTGGGGGAGSVGGNGSSTISGDGGAGHNYISVFGTAVGDSGWFASGGGGGYGADGGTSYSGIGSSSNGGGTDGGGDEASGVGSVAATANSGGGSGGGSSATTNNGHHTGNGGSGVVLVRYATAAFTGIVNLTLQSIDTTALATPTQANMIMLMENGAGTATLNTDIKGYISRDSGTTFTQGTLVDEGTWGTNKKILAFHDLDISGQPSGTSMCYKITTHNQVASSKETKIHATSIGWK